MRVNTNIAAMSAHRSLQATNQQLAVSTTRLSTGFRINRSADDAAGLSIANNMRGDVRALQQAQRNATQGVSYLQIADGAVDTISKVLDRVKELATQASSANVDDEARGKINAEFSQLKFEIDRISDGTKYQSTIVLDNTPMTFRVGLGTDVNSKIEVTLGALHSSALGLAGTSMVTTEGAEAVLIALAGTEGVFCDDAFGNPIVLTPPVHGAYHMLNEVSGRIGAAQNRLEFASANLGTVIQNTAAAESVIRDVDMAAEMMQFSKNNILAQAGTSMLAQANQAGQGVLSLLRG